MRTPPKSSCPDHTTNLHKHKMRPGDESGRISSLEGSGRGRPNPILPRPGFRVYGTVRLFPYPLVEEAVSVPV
jgi:hypothetical protein